MAEADRTGVKKGGGGQACRDALRAGGCGAGVIALLLFMPFCEAALTSESHFTVSTEISEGTCTVLLVEGENQSALGGERLSIGLHDTASSALAGGGVGNMQGVTLQVAHCQGQNSAGKTPSVIVTGTTSISGQPYLFRDTGTITDPGDSRLGIVLSTAAPTPNANGISPWAPTNYLRNNEHVPLTTPVVPGAPMVNQNINLYAGLSCGDATACGAGGALTAGQVKATFTFTFAYR